MQCIRDIMTREVRHIRPDTTLREAAREMRDHSVGCLPILDNGKVVGVLTDRDIVLRAVAEGRGPDTVTAGEAMTNKPVIIGQDEPVAEGARVMKSRAIRRLVAVDDHGTPVGIVSLGDLAAAHQDRETEEVAEQVFHSPCCAAAAQPRRRR